VPAIQVADAASTLVTDGCCGPVCVLFLQYTNTTLGICEAVKEKEVLKLLNPVAKVCTKADRFTIQV
jgi:hypothetical protein